MFRSDPTSMSATANHEIMPYQNLHSSTLKEVANGFSTGLRWFLRFILTLGFFASLVVILCLFSGDPSEETDESAGTNHDRRSHITLSSRGPSDQTNRTGAPIMVDDNQWTGLLPTAAALGEGSGFKSRLEIRKSKNSTDYRVIFGPYDPDTSHEFKKSTEWVNLKFLQPNGLTVPGLEGGIKIRISSFEFHEANGLPVGWIYRGTLSRRESYSVDDMCRYKMDWALPTSLMESSSTHYTSS